MDGGGPADPSGGARATDAIDSGCIDRQHLTEYPRSYSRPIGRVATHVLADLPGTCATASASGVVVGVVAAPGREFAPQVPSLQVSSRRADDLHQPQATLHPPLSPPAQWLGSVDAPALFLSSVCGPAWRLHVPQRAR